MNARGSPPPPPKKGGVFLPHGVKMSAINEFLFAARKLIPGDLYKCLCCFFCGKAKCVPLCTRLFPPSLSFSYCTYPFDCLSCIISPVFTLRGSPQPLHGLKKRRKRRTGVHVILQKPRLMHTKRAPSFPPAYVSVIHQRGGGA